MKEPVYTPTGFCAEHNPKQLGEDVRDLVSSIFALLQGTNRPSKIQLGQIYKLANDIHMQIGTQKYQGPLSSLINTIITHYKIKETLLEEPETTPRHIKRKLEYLCDNWINNHILLLAAEVGRVHNHS